MFVNYLSDRLPVISALLAIGCLQPPSSLASHASSALPLLHRFTPVLVGIALLGHHAAEAKFEVVNKGNFKDTPYYGTPVILNGTNIFFTLNEQGSQVNVTWMFNYRWQIRLEKSDDKKYAEIEISDSCKWAFSWLDTQSFQLTANDKRPEKAQWQFGPDPIRKLRIEIRKQKRPAMDIYEETKNDPLLIGPNQIFYLDQPEYCMLDTKDLSINITNSFSVSMTNTESCTINVTILNAQLLYDVYESTPTQTTTVSGNTTSANDTTTSNITRTAISTTTGSHIIYYAAAGGAVGFVVLAVVVGVIIFCCIRRRRQPPFDKDVDSAQITEYEVLIEWDDLMAHAPYKPQLAKQLDMVDWPFVTGDKVDLSTITEYPFTDHYKELTFLEDVKGNEDYGVASGKYEGKDNRAVIYYSKSSDRIKAFAYRLSHLDALSTRHKCPYGNHPVVSNWWVSPDPEKFSYLVVHYHGRSLSDAIKDAQFHERIGFTYTTFAAVASIHTLGCVHRDVNPAAFVVGSATQGDDKTCKISHLSVSRVLYNVLDKTWMPCRRRVNYFGTHKYASRAAHAQQERSFKDDVESWFYTAIELIWPTTAKELVMPWHVLSSEIGLTDRAELHRKYKKAKDKFLRNFSKNKWIVTFPAAQFRILAKEILKMKYETMDSDYRPRCVEVLHGMIEQFPTQFGEASQYEIVTYLTGLNDMGCSVHPKGYGFKF